MLQFVREIPIRIILQKTPSSRRGFLFHLAAGFARQDGKIDPLSGMSVNLMLVDGWLAELKTAAEQKDWSNLHDLVNSFRAELIAKAASCDVQLHSLVLREERGLCLSWNLSDAPTGVRWTYAHYLELLPVGGEFELVRVGLTWLRAESCDIDLQHEGFKIMKSLQNASGLEDLLSKIGLSKGHLLESGSLLQDIQVRLSSQDILLTL
ncbi:hypothetical protein EZJ49_08750 [Bdellovibrio bacteriovorus]|uniref:hypothetical protein n=1 Tax=Bdellovibrio bacteriovorus TaxID=959 RepID=UPI0021D2533B|nr:hypothetical protein [Bdellovibrio bacteriovorus]UXR63164.1 hypothetical protein EZJ49_08750 [Bdellovibrio bacteriovorus]